MSPLAYDGFLATPTEHENYFLGGQSPLTHRLDHSRSSSISKESKPPSWLHHPKSSNQSIAEEEVHDDVEIFMEGIDFGWTADVALSEEAPPSYQPDFPNLLGGLGSPIQQKQDLQHDGHACHPSQELAEWRLDETAAGGSLERTTEPFPDLFRDDGYSQGLDFSENVYRRIPLSTSSDKFQCDLTSSYPPTSHHWPPFHDSEQISSLAPERNAAQPRDSHWSFAHSVAGENPLPALPVRNKSNKSKSLGVSRRSRRSSVNDGKKSVALTRVNSGLRRGVREGQLPHAKALEIAQKRGNKSVCIGCKSARVTVSPWWVTLCHLHELTNFSANIVPSTDCHATSA